MTLPDATYGCTFGPQEMRLFGARVVLNDTSNPVPTTVSGSLVTEPRLAGPLDVTLNASDTGSGVYRVLLLVDDQLVASNVIDGNGGACADVNAANSDPYEFGSQTPCKRAAGGTFAFDSSQLPDGAHNLKVQVEDGAGNATTVVNRAVTIVAGRGPANGAPASDGARLDVRWTRTRSTTLRTGRPKPRGPHRQAGRRGRPPDLGGDAGRDHAHDRSELARARGTPRTPSPARAGASLCG